MYQYIVFAHILGIFGFLFAHGSAAAVSFRLRRERNIERMNALLDLSSSVAIVARVSLLVLLAAGVGLGFMGHWWGHWWIWVSLVIFVLMAVSMTPLAQRSFGQIRQLMQAADTASGNSEPQLSSLALEKQVTALVADIHPVALTIVAFGGLTIILWLMMFKPF